MTFSVSLSECGLDHKFFHDAIAVSSPSFGTKTRVCVVYYETARCPYNAGCEHAHHFAELDRETQEKLLDAVSPDTIPRHFTEPSALPSLAASASASASAAAAPPPAKRRPSAAASSYGPRGRGAVGPAAPYDKSFSSVASSSESLLPGSGSAVASGRGSPVKAARRDEEPFRIRLPARCRYPHRATTGTYYDILGVGRGAAQDEIIERYRQWQREGYKRAKREDQQRADAMDTIVVEARNVLGHPALRAEYDRTLPGVWAGENDYSMRQTATAISSVNSSYTYNTDLILNGSRSGFASGKLTRKANSEDVTPRNMLSADNSIW